MYVAPDRIPDGGKDKRKVLYQLFKKHESNCLVATLAYLGWFLVDHWKRRKRSKEQPVYSKGRTAVKIGMICDQMTFDNFKEECSVVAITPQNWRTVLLKMPPDFLLCESAWSGLEDSKGCWRGRIYRNHYVLFNQRKVVFDILKTCRLQGIPAVFWNKEDPTFFGNQKYDFVDTALHFDCIFTTAKECIPRYRALGHTRVYLLKFGFSPWLFNPLGTGSMRHEAFFAGSWYRDQAERCRDMEQLFQYSESNGIPYTIYDRNYHSKSKANQFPPKYADKLRPPIPFVELSHVTKRYLYALNINTVKDSETMFARRVYEMMAENHVIISNRSRGLEREFPESVWYCDQKTFPEDDPEMRRKNLEQVFRFHTCEKRLDFILRILGMEAMKPDVRLYVFSADRKYTDHAQTGNVPGVHIEFRILSTEVGLGADEKFEELKRDSFVAVLKNDIDSAKIKWDFLLAQFAYLPMDCGVRIGNAEYEIVKDRDNWNCIFPVEVLGGSLEHFQDYLKKLVL